MKVLKMTYTAALIGFFTWLTASWIDVILHNLTTATYQPWNIIGLLFG